MQTTTAQQSNQPSATAVVFTPQRSAQEPFASEERDDKHEERLPHGADTAGQPPPRPRWRDSRGSSRSSLSKSSSSSVGPTSRRPGDHIPHCEHSRESSGGPVPHSVRHAGEGTPRATTVVAQTPTDCQCDRLVSSAYKITLKGESMRRRRPQKPKMSSVEPEDEI